MPNTLSPDGAAPVGADAAPADFLAGFISEADYAARRGVSLRTCQRDRARRQGPPFVLFGKRVYYRVEAVRAWLVSREQSLDRGPAARRGGRAR